MVKKNRKSNLKQENHQNIGRVLNTYILSEYFLAFLDDLAILTKAIVAVIVCVK